MIRNGIGTIVRERITGMRITSGRSWGARWWSRFTKGQLDFGPWEQIFYGEFDGRRAKRVMIKIIGE